MCEQPCGQDTSCLLALKLLATFAAIMMVSCTMNPVCIVEFMLFSRHPGTNMYKVLQVSWYGSGSEDHTYSLYINNVQGFLALDGRTIVRFFNYVSKILGSVFHLYDFRLMLNVTQ